MALPEIAPVQSVRSLRRVGREALAFARQASLIHRDARPKFPAGDPAASDVVVLLHGLFATAGVLRPLRRQIEAQTGARTATLTYLPGPGVEATSRRLAMHLRRLPTDVRVHLVGHSMGGIIARHCAQEFGRGLEIAQTISMGSPFRGTRHARLMPAPAGRDISPDSSLLRDLADKSAASGLPHLSITAQHDQVVTELAQFEVGEHIQIPECGHNGLLYDSRVAGIVVGRVRRYCGRESGLLRVT